MNGVPLKKKERVFNDPKPIEIPSLDLHPRNWYSLKWIAINAGLFFAMALPDVLFGTNQWTHADFFILAIAGALTSPFLKFSVELLLGGGKS